MAELDYSIIVPVYFNEGSIHLTYEALLNEVVEKNKHLRGEIIFVDDGSGDNSYKEILEVRSRDPELVKVIKLTRNFGQSSARLAGFHYAKGKCIIGISADLQDPPELINEMMRAFFEEQYDAVACIRTARDEALYRRITSRVFYSLMRWLSFSQMPVGGFDYYLISERLKRTILENYEANAFFQGQILWSGYRLKYIPYKRRERTIGTSKWTFGKKLKMLIDGVLSYSYFPIRIMSVLGGIVAALGFLYALWIVIAKIIGRIPIQGWAPIVILILVLSGIQMLMLGIIGEYLWRTLDQVRNRKPFVVEEVHFDPETVEKN